MNVERNTKDAKRLGKRTVRGIRL